MVATSSWARSSRRSLQRMATCRIQPALLALLKDDKIARRTALCKGVGEETTTDVQWLTEELLARSMNINSTGDRVQERIYASERKGEMIYRIVDPEDKRETDDERVIALKEGPLRMEFRHVSDGYRAYWQAPRDSVKQMVQELVGYAAKSEGKGGVVRLGIRCEEIRGVPHDSLWRSMLESIREPARFFPCPMRSARGLCSAPARPMARPTSRTSAMSRPARSSTANSSTARRRTLSASSPCARTPCRSSSTRGTPPASGCRSLFRDVLPPFQGRDAPRLASPTFCLRSCLETRTSACWSA
mmetsp:Transcript_51574/g.154136  ORF Transcript_51574/g.154136 Transcript_51574/m.154136 type:complete len:302 (+) Transcript_51574:2-907(+)